MRCGDRSIALCIRGQSLLLFENILGMHWANRNASQGFSFFDRANFGFWILDFGLFFGSRPRPL
jgi:hypothetical protein